MVDLLTFGEALGLAATAPGEPLETTRALRLGTAGAEATVAVGMSRLGHSTRWVGAVGDDEIGRRVVRDLRAENVDASHVRTAADAPTGFMLRDHRTPDHVAVAYYRTGSAGSGLCVADVEAGWAADPGVAVVHATGITPLLGPSAAAATRRALTLARDSKALVSFDVNYRRALGGAAAATHALRDVVGAVDLLFVGHDEMFLLTARTDPLDAARDVLAMGPTEVVVKLGAAGAVAVTADGETAHAGAVPVAVVDVIGAGDSFVAGYLSARADGLDVTGRLHRATVCAACTIGTHGDWEGLPRRAELDLRRSLGHTVR